MHAYEAAASCGHGQTDRGEMNRCRMGWWLTAWAGMAYGSAYVQSAMPKDMVCTRVPQISSAHPRRDGARAGGVCTEYDDYCLWLAISAPSEHLQ